MGLGIRERREEPRTHLDFGGVAELGHLVIQERVGFIPLRHGPRPSLRFPKLTLHIEKAIQPAVLKSLLHPHLNSLTHNLHSFNYHHSTQSSHDALDAEEEGDFHLPTYLALLDQVAINLTSFHHSSKLYFFKQFTPFLKKCHQLVHFTYTSPFVTHEVLEIVLGIPSSHLEEVAFQSRLLNGDAGADFEHFVEGLGKGRLKLCWVSRKGGGEGWEKLREVCSKVGVQLVVEFDCF